MYSIITARFMYIIYLSFIIQYGVPLAVLVYVVILLYRKARPRHEVSFKGMYKGHLCTFISGGWYMYVHVLLYMYCITNTMHSAAALLNIM